MCSALLILEVCVTENSENCTCSDIFLVRKFAVPSETIKTHSGTFRLKNRKECGKSITEKIPFCTTCCLLLVQLPLDLFLLNIHPLI
jgi:hypothetical protein